MNKASEDVLPTAAAQRPSSLLSVPHRKRMTFWVSKPVSTPNWRKRSTFAAFSPRRGNMQRWFQTLLSLRENTVLTARRERAKRYPSMED